MPACTSVSVFLTAAPTVPTGTVCSSPPRFSPVSSFGLGLEATCLLPFPGGCSVLFSAFLHSLGGLTISLGISVGGLGISLWSGLQWSGGIFLGPACYVHCDFLHFRCFGLFWRIWSFCLGD